MGDRKDPYRGYNFKLEIDGVVRAAFHECSGLEEGEHSTAEARIPGSHKTGDVTLKRGVIAELSLWPWLQEVAADKTQRKNGSIIRMGEAGREKTRWNFVKGWPKKWDCPRPIANATEVAIETLELGHEGLTRA
jgi:phage tail-like protein